MCLFIKALGVDTEDDIYQLSNYFLKGPREGEQAAEGSEKGAKDEETVEEKEGIEEKSGGVDEGEKKDDESSVVFSVDEKASDSSSVKAHLSGNEAAVLILVLSLCTTTFQCRLKALVNVNTLLRTHCCRRKCFPVCPRAQHLLRTQILCPGNKNVSDFVQKHFVSATNVSQFA